MRYLILLFVLACTKTKATEEIVRFKISKPYNVLNFIETAVGTHGTSITLKQYIETNIPKEDIAFKNLLTDFTGINLHRAYKREEFPASRRQYKSIYDLIVIAAVQSSNLTEFKRRTVGILSNNEHQKLFKILESAEIYYDRIIWKKYQRSTEKQVNALSTFSKQASEIFIKLRVFYNSSWTNDVPFDVAIYPIPGKRGVTSATPHATSLCVGVLTDEEDHAGRMGVVMHEICHVLYDEQLSSFQHHLDSAFSNSASAYSKLAYGFFDEALATALGNGWSYQYINDKLDTSQWYNNKYIDGFAHALYPLVIQYLTQDKIMDKKFIDGSILAFNAAFPQSVNDYSILLNNAIIYFDLEPQKRQQLNNWLTKYFQSSRYNISSPVLHEFSIDAMKKGKETQLIVIDRNNASTITKLTEVIPELSDYTKKKPAGNYVLSFFDSNKRPVIILDVNTFDLLETALVKMYNKKYIDEKNPFISLLE